MTRHEPLVAAAVARWNDVHAAIGGATPPTPLTVLNAIAGLPGVDPAASTAARALRRSIPKATRHWAQNVAAFDQLWTAIGPPLDAASDAASMITALDALTAAGSPVDLAPTRALVVAGQASIYDPVVVAGQPAPGSATNVAELLQHGVKGAVKGAVGANGTPAEAVAVVASLSELVRQHWT